MTRPHSDAWFFAPVQQETKLTWERRKNQRLGAVRNTAAASSSGQVQKSHCGDHALLEVRQKCHRMYLAARNIADHILECLTATQLAAICLTLLLLFIAVIASLLGFTGIYVAATGIAKILFFIFLVLILISLIGGRTSRPPPP